MQTVDCKECIGYEQLTKVSYQCVILGIKDRIKNSTKIPCKEFISIEVQNYIKAKYIH
jgi:hypothetical protein